MMRDASIAFVLGLLCSSLIFSMLMLVETDGTLNHQVLKQNNLNDHGCPRGPKFRLMSYRRQHLPLVVNAFEKMGFTENRNTTKFMHDVENYDASWWYRYPNYLLYSTFHPHSRINHFRGNSVLTKKQDLFFTFQEAQEEFGPLLYDFIPDHYLIPEHRDEFLRRNRNQNASSMHGKDDADFGNRWIVKSRNHGGIQLFQSVSQVKKLSMIKDSMISHYVEPLLIDSFKWDFGMYVYVASLEPLRIYVHQNGLVRMCLEPYPAKLSPDTPVDQYVVKEYGAPWEKPSLAKLYGNRLPTESSQGTFHSMALCRHIESLNLPNWGCAEWWEGMKSAAVKMIIHVTPRLRKFAAEVSSHRHAQFEMFRLDFNTDPSGKPWLVEINMSPNLLPKYFKTGNDAAMKQSVIDGVLQMSAAHARGDFPNPYFPYVVDSDIDSGCGENIHEIEKLSQPQVLTCVLEALASKGNVHQTCDVCLGKDVLAEIAHATYEFTRKGDFELAYPPFKYFNDNRPTRLPKVTHKKIWHDGIVQTIAKKRFAKSHLDHAMHVVFDQPSKTFEYLVHQLEHKHLGKTCFSRGNCNNAGACIAGHCVCDKDWTGQTCQSFTGTAYKPEHQGNRMVTMPFVFALGFACHYYFFGHQNKSTLQKHL